jgi:membrane protein DedA with SNARE-associated domain
VEPLGLVALFVLVFVKEVGVPLPPPMALVVLGTGVLAARGEMDPVRTVATICVAALLGAIGEFLLVRHGARAWILTMLGRMGFEPHHIQRAIALSRRLGGLGVALGRMIPGPRGVIVPASALAHLDLVPFVVGFAIGNTVYTVGQFALGMVAGDWALATLPFDAPVLTLIFLAVSAAIWGAWVLYLRYRSRTADGSPEQPVES